MKDAFAFGLKLLKVFQFSSIFSVRFAQNFVGGKLSSELEKLLAQIYPTASKFLLSHFSDSREVGTKMQAPSGQEDRIVSRSLAE